MRRNERGHAYAVVAVVLHAIMMGFATGIALATVIFWAEGAPPRTDQQIQEIACERAICPTPEGGQ